MRRISLRAPEGFRTLASILRGAGEPAVDPVPIGPAPETVCCDCEQAALRDLFRDIRLFRARIAEAVDDALEKITGDIAAQVLARELQLGSADIQAIAEAALRRYCDEEPLRVRVSPSDAGSISLDCPIAIDANLRSGDIVIELPGGSIDATLGCRLDSVLRGVA